MSKIVTPELILQKFSDRLKSKTEQAVEKVRCTLLLPNLLFGRLLKILGKSCFELLAL